MRARFFRPIFTLTPRPFIFVSAGAAIASKPLYAFCDAIASKPYNLGSNRVPTQRERQCKASFDPAFFRDTKSAMTEFKQCMEEAEMKDNDENVASALPKNA